MNRALASCPVTRGVCIPLFSLCSTYPSDVLSIHEISKVFATAGWTLCGGTGYLLKTKDGIKSRIDDEMRVEGDDFGILQDNWWI